MQIKQNANLLRIFIGESDKISSTPVYERIVIEAKKFGLAGSTVLKGIMGFGSSSRIHTTKILRLSEDLPLVVEIVDEIEKIKKFLPILDDIFQKANCGGLVTIEESEVIKYVGKKQ
jgi:PII-like signaling protein